MKHIQLYESFSHTLDTDDMSGFIHESLSPTLKPHDVGGPDDVIFHWMEDGIYYALVKKAEAQEILKELKAKHPGFRIQEVPAEGIAYIVCDEKGNVHFKDPGYEVETVDIGGWMDPDPEKDNPEQMPERGWDIVGNLKRGYLVDSLREANPDSFFIDINQYLGMPFTYWETIYKR
jgi:hypothetical protein